VFQEAFWDLNLTSFASSRYLPSREMSHAMSSQDYMSEDHAKTRPPQPPPKGIVAGTTPSGPLPTQGGFVDERSSKHKSKSRHNQDYENNNASSGTTLGQYGETFVQSETPMTLTYQMLKTETDQPRMRQTMREDPRKEPRSGGWGLVSQNLTS
jgi:hypothetical protein